MATALPQIKQGACSASVELTTMENGDRAEHYKWGFDIPHKLRSFEEDFLLPTPSFSQGLFSVTSWKQRFSSRYQQGTFRMEIPDVILEPGMEESELTWSVTTPPELGFRYPLINRRKERFGAEVVTVLWKEKSTGWQPRPFTIFEFPLIRIEDGLKERIVERILISVRLDGNRKPLTPLGEGPQVAVMAVGTSLFNKHEYSDITLLCQGETIYCHKNILCVGSPVFKKMFTSDTKEAKDGEVEIEDADKDSLKLMLEWMYGLDIRSKLENVQQRMDLLKLADRYFLDLLKEVLADEILKKITVENAFELYVLGDTCGVEKLKMRASEIMKRHSKEVVSKDEVFQDLSALAFPNSCRRFARNEDLTSFD